MEANGEVVSASAFRRLEDWEVGGSSLFSDSCRAVSLDKKLYSTLSLSTQVYKWVPVG